jgi:uncharacterized protein (UPF0305 family)
MKAQEFDQKFDDGEDITEMLDLSQAKRPLSAQKEEIVSIYLPVQVLRRINQEASRLGVKPIRMIQSWLAEDLGINNPREQSQSSRRVLRRINQEASRLGVKPIRMIQSWLAEDLTINNPRERSQSPRRTNRHISGRTRVVRLDIKLSVQRIERINQEASRLGVKPREIIQNRLTKHSRINNPRERSRNPRRTH